MRKVVALAAVVAAAVLLVLAADQPVRVKGDEQQAKLVSQVKPEYPPEAKQARIQGTVRLEVLIAKDGAVKEIKVISGHPKLVEAAVEAVRQWKYEPTYLNGESVEVITNVDVNFRLSE